jgi:hypothetical protein
MAQPLRIEDTGMSPLPDAGVVTDQAAYQAYQILRFGFVVAPIIAGIDKFFHYLADWSSYLAPFFPNLLHVSAETFMRGVGVIEIIAGLIVAIRPRVGAWIVGLWLCGIIVNLLLVPGIFNYHAGHAWGLDLALRDLGLALGAFAL